MKLTMFAFIMLYFLNSVVIVNYKLMYKRLYKEIKKKADKRTLMMILLNRD